MYLSVVLLIGIYWCIHHRKVVKWRHFSFAFRHMVNLLLSIIALMQVLEFVWHDSCILFVLDECHVSVLSKQVGSCLLHNVLRARGWCLHLLVYIVKCIYLLFELWAWKVNVFDLLIHLLILLSETVICQWALVDG